MDKALRTTIKERLQKSNSNLNPIVFDYIECLLKTYDTLPEDGCVFIDSVGIDAATEVALSYGRSFEQSKDETTDPLSLAMAYAKKHKAVAVAIMHERFERNPEILNSFYKFITKKPNYVIPVILRKYHKVDDLQGRGINNEQIYFKQYFDLNED